nr:hypothetical protein BaRGS_005176 [Batillaria attramentaria]
MSDEASKAMMAADDFALPAFVTFLSLGQHARFARRVGLARGKYKVDVPETTGDPGFVRVFRAQLPGFMLSLNAVLLLMGMSGVGVTAALLRRYADLDLAAMAKGFVEGILKKD